MNIKTLFWDKKSWNHNVEYDNNHYCPDQGKHEVMPPVSGEKDIQ
jgi:hypothetical protein